MWLLLALGLLVAGLCPPVHCAPGGVLDPPNVTQEDLHNETPVDSLRLASSNTDFALSLYKQLAARTPNKNVIFSPLSISIALAFLSLGAQNTTLTEILEGLKFNLTETPDTEIHRGFQHLLRTLRQPSNELQLSVGNAMFVSESLKLLEKFMEDARVLYASEAFSTNFQESAAAKKLINDYVKNQTQGRIVDLVKDLDLNTAMVLVNYIFLKAKWKTPFDPRDTFKSKFYVSKSRSVKVPMMSLEDVWTPYFRDEALGCTMVELPYTSTDSALFILPDQGSMGAVEASLLPETLRRWTDSLQMRTIDNLYLPKFSISSSYNLEEILPQLGVREVFTPQADLSGVTGEKNLAVSQVVHKALLDVAEEGTEAAAATGSKIILLSGKMGPLMTVHFNRPFLVCILHRDTKNILFWGKVTNPNQA
ncbi:alpha-1-antichymotrypsin [Mustela putorius furo]|uniref:Alpha-1-antichymotrypsin n=1 Tax=Mustela putorius furo TaxID=9669 RepID=A0A8U0RTJ7_MUSPF|nr:alpha-1-antichymotrypsin [Mustela putorius furo]XP_044929176.1 alpha-1-antichymotrypsin [Mustela putorius furo]